MDLLAPVRPVVALEYHIGLVAEALVCLDDVLCPIVGIAHLCAAQGVQIMHRAGAVFRHPEGTVFREIGVHLGRGFGAGGQLEFDLQPVDGQLRNIFPDLVSRSDEGHRTGGLSHADAHAQRTLFALVKHRAVLELCAPCHGDACIDIFADGVLQKARRRKHKGLAGSQLLFKRELCIRHLLPGNNALHAAEVVHMRVAVQHRLDVQRAEAVLHQLLGSLHVFLAHQHIKHDPAVVGADKGRIGHIKAAHLINAIAHFKQTSFSVELGIPPQAGVYSVWSIPVQIAIALQIPCRSVIITIDDPAFRVVQPAALGVGKLPPVRKIQLFIPFGVGLCCDGRCAFGLARLGGILENVCDKIQAVFCGIFRSMGRQRCAARQHCSSRSGNKIPTGHFHSRFLLITDQFARTTGGCQFVSAAASGL